MCQTGIRTLSQSLHCALHQLPNSALLCALMSHVSSVSDSHRPLASLTCYLDVLPMKSCDSLRLSFLRFSKEAATALSWTRLVYKAPSLLVTGSDNGKLDTTCRHRIGCGSTKEIPHLHPQCIDSLHNRYCTNRHPTPTAYNLHGSTAGNMCRSHTWISAYPIVPMGLFSPPLRSAKLQRHFRNEEMEFDAVELLMFLKTVSEKGASANPAASHFDHHCSSQRLQNTEYW